MKHSKKIIGLTGGIGTGKSTVTGILRKKGYRVIDADEVSRQIYLKGSPVYEEIIGCFGKSVLDKCGEIDRKALGNLVFSDKDKLKQLNDITHPGIIQKIKDDAYEILMEENVVWTDIPLLIESLDLIKEIGIDYDEIVLVYAGEKMQLERIINRDGISKKEAQIKIRAQMDMDKKKKFASYIINNESDIKNLETEVEKMLTCMKI